MDFEKPQQPSSEEQEKQRLSPEGQEAFEKVQEGRGKEAEKEALSTRIEEIKSQINEGLAGDPFLVDDSEKAEAFLKSTYSLIAEGSNLIRELKEAGAPETQIMALENKFGAYREEMAKGEEILAERIMGNAA